MKKLIEFFVKYPIWTNSLIVFILIVGILSYNNIKKGRFPENREKNIVVNVVYPGASPQQMEEGVTIKVEEALKGINGIEEFSSSSSENVATVNVEGELGYDIDELLIDIKNAVDQIPNFPAGVERVQVYKVKPTDNVMYLTLYGNVDPMALFVKAEEIENEFRASGKVSQLTIAGLPSPEYTIHADKQKIEDLNITLSDISNAIKLNNQDITGGMIRANDENILIRGDFRSNEIADIENIVIKGNKNGTYIKIKDVAEVKYDFEESSNSTYFNGKQAASINVRKIPSEDIMVITDYLKEYVEIFNMKNDVLQMYINFDASRSVQSRIDLLFNNGIIGLILVLIVLGIFLNTRLAFWVAAGIPISFFAMFIVTGAIGITINQISLFGMILVIGILVDDGIVIGENIYAKLEKGIEPRKAVVIGSLEVLPAVFTSILTTVLAFGLFFFLEGRIGEFMVEMAIVVISCLLLSLVEAALVLPAHLSELKLGNPNPVRKKINQGIDYVRYKVYGKALFFIIKFRWPFAFLPIVLMFVVNYMMTTGAIQKSFFPRIDRDVLNIDVEYSPGTKSDKTLQTLQYVEKTAYAVNDSLKKVYNADIIISTRITIGTTGNNSDGHKGVIRLQFQDGEKRKISSSEVAALIRKKVGKISGAEKFLIGAHGFFGKPVSIGLVSKNEQELTAAKNALMDSLRANELLTDIVDQDILGKKEISIELKPKAVFLGLNRGDILSQLRQGFFGIESQRLMVGTKETKVWVRLAKQDRNSLAKLENFKIKTSNGNQYPFNELVTYQIARKELSIKRFNGGNFAQVEADINDPTTPVDPITEQLNEQILPAIFNTYPTVSKVVGGQEKEGSKLSASIAKAGPIFLLLIFFTIMLTFRNVYQPLLVLYMAAAGVYGGIYGHYLHNTQVVIMSWFGMIAVAGVVINDAVVFTDRFNRNLKEGMKLRSAIHDAGVSRFRPIILTSITTIVGLYPIIWEKSLQAKFLIPMAITVALGVLFGTLIILICYPAVLMVFNDIRKLFIWMINGVEPTREYCEPAFREEIKNGNVSLEDNEGKNINENNE